MIIDVHTATERQLDWMVDLIKVDELEAVLLNHSYWVGERDPDIRRDFVGNWMVNDPDDPEGYAIVGDNRDELVIEAHHHLFDAISWSTDFAQGGPIIESEWISVVEHGAPLAGHWVATRGHTHAHGKTFLVASMRCYVILHLGEEVDVPEELS